MKNGKSMYRSVETVQCTAYIILRNQTHTAEGYPTYHTTHFCGDDNIFCANFTNQNTLVM